MKSPYAFVVLQDAAAGRPTVLFLDELDALCPQRSAHRQHEARVTAQVRGRLLRDAKGSLGDAKSSLGDAKSSLGDAESSLGDAESSLGDVYRLFRY